MKGRRWKDRRQSPRASCSANPHALLVASHRRLVAVAASQSASAEPQLGRRLARRERRLVGLSRFELLTPRLSSVCSNQLSYRPSQARRFSQN
jgi:hypothetical protein